MGDTEQRDDTGARTLRSNLARVVSYDLRAPVRAIRGFGKLLDAGGGLDGSGRDQLARIREAADRLDGMMADLVDWLRVDATDLRRAPVDLSLLVDWATMEMLDADPGRDAQVDVQPEMQAIGDEQLLRLMLQRLLRAAWQRAGTDAPIRITVSAGDDAAATLLRIHDAGHADSGPTSEFTALRDALDADIGVAIARLIAERHGGALESHSDTNGTTAWVRLPD